MSLFSAVHLEEHHLPGLPLSMVGLHIFLIWDHFFYNEAMAVISAWWGTLWWWWGCSWSGGLMRSATSWRARRWSVFPSTQSGSGWTLRAPDKRFTSPFSSSSAFSSSSSHHFCQDQAEIAMVGWRETSWVGTGLTCIERKWKSSKYPNISPYGASKLSPPSTNKPKTITVIKKGGQHKHETSSRSKYLFSCWPTNETQPTPGKGIITS